MSPEVTPDLLRAAQHGDTRAMNDLLDILSPRVRRWCGSIALQDGPDAAQEALIAIFRHLHSVRDPASLHGWARVIAVREAVRVARRARREIPHELTEVPGRGDPQLATDITDVLARLRPDCRAVLVLRDLEGLDENTVSQILAVRVGTVKSRLHRARHSFRKVWPQ
jgi:RNA polymerase sigma-70 factor (ECF subfamily)